MKQVLTIFLCVLFAFLCSISAASEQAENVPIITDELWLSVYGLMAESGALDTNFSIPELAGDDIDARYLLYSLFLVRNSFAETVTVFQDIADQNPDAVAADADNLTTQLQAFTTETKDLSTSDTLAPVVKKMGAVTGSLARFIEKTKEIAPEVRYQEENVDKEAFAAEYLALLESNEEYEKAVREALTELQEVSWIPGS